MKTLHPLEHAVDHLADLVRAEEHPDDLAAWAVAALASALGVPVAVGVIGDVDASIEMYQDGLADLIYSAGPGRV